MLNLLFSVLTRNLYRQLALIVLSVIKNTVSFHFQMKYIDPECIFLDFAIPYVYSYT